MTRPPTAAELDAYRAQTDRLLKLCDFVARVGPCVGETQASGFDRGDSLDELAGPEIVGARDAALVDALDAIAEIARNS